MFVMTLVYVESCKSKSKSKRASEGTLFKTRWGRIVETLKLQHEDLKVFQALIHNTSRANPEFHRYTDHSRLVVSIHGYKLRPRPRP